MKKLYASKPYDNLIKRHLYGLFFLFTPFFGTFHFRSLSGLSPTSS